MLLASLFALLPQTASARSHHRGYAAATQRHTAHAYRPRFAVASYRHARSWRRTAYAPRPAYPTARPAGGSRVIAEAMRYVGAGNVTGTRGAWCADYASMILRRTGHQPLAGRSVAAALAYGPRVRNPKPGDLVVINTRAGYAQHVGFFAGWDRGRMVMVSGNWRHRVAVAPIPPGAVAAFVGV